MEKPALVEHRFPGNIGKFGRLDAKLDVQLAPVECGLQSLLITPEHCWLEHAIEQARADLLDTLGVGSFGEVEPADRHCGGGARFGIDYSLANRLAGAQRLARAQDRLLQGLQIFPEFFRELAEIVAGLVAADVSRNLVGAARSGDAQSQDCGAHPALHTTRAVATFACEAYPFSLKTQASSFAHRVRF